MNAGKKYTLTANDAQEVLHKMSVLADEPDLQECYGLTQGQATTLRDSVPPNGGVWSVPGWGVAAVRDEMDDHCAILLNIADDARSANEQGQALSIAKQAKRLSSIFSA